MPHGHSSFCGSTGMPLSVKNKTDGETDPEAAREPSVICTGAQWCHLGKNFSLGWGSRYHCPASHRHSEASWGQKSL